MHYGAAPIIFVFDMSAHFCGDRRIVLYHIFLQNSKAIGITFAIQPFQKMNMKFIAPMTMGEVL